MPRKIVQITATPGDDVAGSADVVYALCNDGSLWELYNEDEGKWSRLPDIPQSQPELSTTGETETALNRPKR